MLTEVSCTFSFLDFFRIVTVRMMQVLASNVTRKPVGFTQSCFLSFACTPCRRLRAHHAVVCMHTWSSCVWTPHHHVCAHHFVCMHTTLCVCTPCHCVCAHHVVCVHTTSCACTPRRVCAHHAVVCMHTTPWCTFQSNLTPKSCDHSSQPIRRLHSLKSL